MIEAILNPLQIAEEEGWRAGKKDCETNETSINPYPTNTRQNIRWSIGWHLGNNITQRNNSHKR